MREHEQGFGKALDEDVTIGVILALAPPPAPNHCHLNSHLRTSQESALRLQSGTSGSCRIRTCTDGLVDAQQGPQKGQVDKNEKGGGKHGKCKGAGGKDARKGKGQGNDNDNAKETFRGLLQRVQSLGSHEGRLLVQRNRQERERHCIIASRKQCRLPTRIRNDKNTVTIRWLQSSNRRHTLDVLCDEPISKRKQNS